jgi:hypothetical protein
VNTTGYCPRFNPEGWDGQELHFENKVVPQGDDPSIMHIPVNMAAYLGASSSTWARRRRRCRAFHHSQPGYLPVEQ